MSNDTTDSTPADEETSSDPTPGDVLTRRGITVRSVVVGLAGAALICGFTFFNDRVLRQTFLVGNNFPASVYGCLIMFLFFINRWMKKWAFNGAELAVILTLTLAACCIPGSGLLRTFTSSTSLPHHYQRTQSGWQKYDVVNQVPKHMMVDAEFEDGRAVDGMVQGWGGKDEDFSLASVPWAAWKRTLIFWIPLILTLWVAMIMMTLIYHKQWSEHECLSYPLANFTNDLLPPEGATETPIFRQKAFWISALVVFLIYMNNYTQKSFPEYMVRIPTRLYFAPLFQEFQVFRHGFGSRLFNPIFYMTALGVAYMLPRSISFSYGIGPYIWAIITGIGLAYGITFNQALDGGHYYMGLTPRSFQLFGANVGIFLIVLYSGRTYLKQVFSQAFGMKQSEEAKPLDRSIIWACRCFMFFMALFVVQLILTGVPWYLAVIYSAILIVFYTVMNRLISETGLFYIQPFFFPCMMMLGVFGAASLGPKVVLIMQMISVVLLIDPRTSLAPFMANSFKVLELRKVKLGRVANLVIVALILGMTIALPVTLYYQYKRGSEIWDGWADVVVPKMPFRNASSAQRRLEARGTLGDAEHPGFVKMLKKFKSNKLCMISLFAGLSAVLLVGMARLRFPWWPLHPLLFVTWSTAPPTRMGASFLLGWMIKSLVMKYGGNHSVNKIKPIIYGLMAGEILAALIPSLFGAAYYFFTGEAPLAFTILPM